MIALNRRHRMDGADLLASLADGRAALAIFDPQYRENLDKLAYGNEGARQGARSRLRQQSTDEIKAFVREIGRALRPSGHMLLWVNKFMVGEAVHKEIVGASPDLQIVDLIHWNNLGFGMGKRTRGVSEYAVVAQKAPVRAKGVWTDNAIRDSWPEKRPGGHPHAKPIELTRRVVQAVTSRGDLVIDPAAGGYGVLEVCKETGRNFIGCNLG